MTHNVVLVSGVQQNEAVIYIHASILFFLYRFLISFYFWVVLYCMNIPVCSTIHPLKNIWVVSSILLLWIKLSCTSMDRFLYEYKFSFLWDKSVTTQLYGKCVFCFVKKFQSIFQGIYTILHSHQQHMRSAISLYLCQHLVLSLFFFCFFIVTQLKNTIKVTLLKHILQWVLV